MNSKYLHGYLSLSLILILSFSCSRHLQKMPYDEAIVIYPAPPDTTRIQYLTSLSSSKDVTGKRSAFGRFIFGESPEISVVKPYGITVKNGKIYICDTGLDCLEIIDIENNSFEYFRPSGSGQLLKPLNCFVDENDYLYVADGMRKQVVIFHSSGNFVNVIGDAEHFKPIDVVVSHGKIWVTNIENNKIHVYDKETYSLLYTMPDSEVGNEDYLYSPTNLDVTDEYVYVTDFGDFKIKVYTHEGEFIRSVGNYGDKIGQFVRPKGIAVDHESNLYVVDAGFENTQIFGKSGELLMFFGGPYVKPGDMWLPAQVTLDYENLSYFEKYVDDRFTLKYLIFVTNQYGPDKINVYGYVAP